jgi:hypothetical protein
MLFPITLILGLLSITPSLAVPIFSADSDAATLLVARDEPQSILEARGESYGLDFDMMEKRDLAGEEMFEELVARSPEPEPMGGFELEDMERRGWFGAALKIGKGIAKLAHKGHKAHQAHQDYKNRHHKRSKAGQRAKNFFKKVGKGVSVYPRDLD